VSSRLITTPDRRAVLVALVAVCVGLVAFVGLVGAGSARAATVSAASAANTSVTAATAAQTTTTAAEKTVTETTTVTAAAGTPVLVTDKTTPPSGYRLTADQVLAIASRSPVVKGELRKHPNLEPYEYTKGAPEWQVSWFTHSSPQRELLQVYVDDNTQKVTQAWTGYQVAWSMARGYKGAFGKIVNSWYIWIPLCLLFVAPFVPWRRRPTLLHLDLVVLLFFSVSLAFFNHAEIGLSVPLVYPPLIYLLVRLLLLAFGKGVPREPLRTVVPVSWLMVAVVFLMAFRIALNVLDSNVIDVGFSGVIGADKLIHGVALYGHWPANNMFGDTYGPFNYFLYVPFRWILGWSGAWDSLPAAHGAAIFFDVGTLVALYFLGRRWRGHSLGVVLAYAWAAYPFTLWSLSSNTNDSLVALMVTLSLLVVSSAPARGAMVALAGLTKFAPFALAPLMLRGIGSPPAPRPSQRSIAWFVIAFAVVVFLCMLPVVLQHDLEPFWHDSIKYQFNRDTPFSIWGLWGHLGAVQHLLQGATIALAVVVMFVPRGHRTPVQVAALAGAVIIALQIVTNYWLYSYTMWFLPAVLFALLASHPEPGEHLAAAWRDLEDRRVAQPAVQIEQPAPTWYRPPAAG
jgi:hypothetical protein